MTSQAQLQEEAGAVLPGTGEERTAETEREREGGREGVGRCVAVCYSGMELAARHLVCVNVRACVLLCE